MFALESLWEELGLLAEFLILDDEDIAAGVLLLALLLSTLTDFTLEFFFDTNCYWGLDKVFILALLFEVGIILSVSRWFLLVTAALISLLAGFFLKSADFILVLFLLFGTRFLLLS